MASAVNSKGKTYRRGDAGYEEARRGASWNANLPARFPDLIVQANTDQDVVDAVKYAKAHGLKIGVKSGGHSWAVNHLRDGGMLLDVSQLNSVSVDRKNLTAIAGPGCTGHGLNAILARERLFFPAGHCKGVCIGGYLLQGGFGWHSRALGPACQSVLGIDYVDANGERKFAGPGANAEIYWAARGSGPGFFGVVTRFHLQLVERPKIIGAKFAFYDARHLEALIRWAHRIGKDIPDSIEFMMLMSRSIPFVRGPGVMMIAPVMAASLTQTRRDLTFMRTRPKGANVVTPFLPMPLSWLYAGVMRHYPDQHNYAVDNMWTHAPADDLLPGLMAVRDSLPQAPTHMLWLNWAPPSSRPDMAFSLEDDLYIALYGVWKDPAHEGVTRGWAREHMAAMAPHASGIQLADENLGQRPAPFMSADHMARLDALRDKYDPQSLFHTYMGRV